MLAKISKFCVGILWTGKPPKKPFRLFRWLFWALGKVLSEPCDKNCLKCEKNYLIKLWQGKKKKKRWNCFFLRFNEMYTCTLKQIATGYTCLSHMIMGNSRSKYSPFQRLKPFWSQDCNITYGLSLQWHSGEAGVWQVYQACDADIRSRPTLTQARTPPLSSSSKPSVKIRNGRM